MWYVVCTRARDLLIVPNLPTSRAASWYRAVRLDKLELPEVNLDGLPEKVAEDRAAEANLQTAEKFAAEAVIVARAHPSFSGASRASMMLIATRRSSTCRRRAS